MDEEKILAEVRRIVEFEIMHGSVHDEIADTIFNRITQRFFHNPAIVLESVIEGAGECVVKIRIEGVCYRVVGKPHPFQMFCVQFETTKEYE